MRLSQLVKLSGILSLTRTSLQPLCCPMLILCAINLLFKTNSGSTHLLLLNPFKISFKFPNTMYGNCYMALADLYILNELAVIFAKYIWKIRGNLDFSFLYEIVSIINNKEQ